MRRGGGALYSVFGKPMYGSCGVWVPVKKVIVGNVDGLGNFGPF